MSTTATPSTTTGTGSWQTGSQWRAFAGTRGGRRTRTLTRCCMRSRASMGPCWLPFRRVSPRIGRGSKRNL
eukprot:11203311-Lingulodinium_polyedra.AAC.1